MNKKKPIIVWMNGKKTKITRNSNRNNNNFSREHAATIDDSDKDDQIPALTRQHDLLANNDNYSKRTNRIGMYKPIIIATVSALAIGLCMGFIMLNMFVGIGQEVSGNVTNNMPIDDTSVINNTEGETEKTDSALSNVTFEQINGYVLQAGVFSGEANAGEWAKKYEQAGFPTMIWKRNDQFFLLAGISSTKEQANVLATELKENKFEIFVKEWNTAETEIQLTKTEGEWLHSFRNIWYEALKTVTSQNIISLDDWNGLIDDFPDQSDRLSTFFETLNNSYKQLGDADQQMAQIILLKQWKQYESVLLK